MKGDKMYKGIQNIIVKKIIELGDKLKIEYNNSNINFDLYVQDILMLLRGRKVPVLFIFKDGHFEKKILPKESLHPIFEMIKQDSLSLAKTNNYNEYPISIHNERISFKFQGFEEPYVYIQE